MRGRGLIIVMTLCALVGCTSGQESDDASGRTVAPGNPTTVTVPPTASAPAATATTVRTSTTSTAPATTTVVPPTTADPSSTTLLATTTAPPSDGLVLTAQGIGPLVFGTSEADTLAVLEDALGAVVSDSSTSYTIDQGDGMYLAEGEVFDHPARRTTCFDNGLCVVFGGVSHNALTLVGWEHNSDGVDPPLTTSDGVAVRSVWADHLDHLDVAEWGCYSVGYATTRDMRVVVFSTGDPFLAYDDEGNQIPTEPDPADVTVTQLSAGSLPGSPEWDC